MKSAFSAAIAITFGLIVLAGYFIELPLLVLLRDVFLRYTVILAAIALVVGVANLLFVHWRKMNSAQGGSSVYSLLLIVSLVITAIVAGLLGPTNSLALWIYQYVQLPVESSLMALLTVVLVVVAARMLRRSANWFNLLFLVTALIMLAGAVPLFGVNVPGLHGTGGLREWIASVPSVAGGRGLLLGIALGTIAVGLRVILGADRPYGR
jgi:hypothetical protein